MDNNKNFFIAIFLSMGILFLWQHFVAGPQMEAEKLHRQKIEAIKAKNKITQAPSLNGVKQSAGASITELPREQVLKTGKRIKISTRNVSGSISLTGARIDDVVLEQYREKLHGSKKVVLLSPPGTKNPFYAEHGWYKPEGTKLKLPDANTVWTIEKGRELTQDTPVTLKYDNGEGLVFHRTIALDADYMFTISQSVENNTGKPVTLYPQARIIRQGMPKVEGFLVLHEGLVGVLGEEGLQEIKYDAILKEVSKDFTAQQSGWMGFTDKYWAAVIIPDQNISYSSRFSGVPGVVKPDFKTEYLLAGIIVPAKGKANTKAHFFAGAKKSALIDTYEDKLKIKSFDLMIDWGWFYFITKPIFWLINWFYHLFGNFGVSILMVTVVIKIALFPLVNKSYVSMGKMKKLQPEVKKLRERYKDDPMKNQQAMMELYKKEQVNPLSGCLPILVTIPVFFALYKVLYGTIEMRHAPFFGWIHDLSAPDPTSPLNLWGILPFDVPSYLAFGIWPIIMGITMWMQMKLNPAQGDPVQQKIFAWMPVVFTVMLARFPAGLVIYYAWNNLLTVIQQSYIMKREGADVNLFENMGIDKAWAIIKEKISGKKS